MMQKHLFEASCCLFQESDGSITVSLVIKGIPDQELGMRISASLEQHVRGPLSELTIEQANEPQPATRTLQ